MHLVGEDQLRDQFPPVRHDDAADRQSATRAIGLSAIGLGLTGLIELAFSIFNGSVGLLGDALHNLSTCRPRRLCGSGSESRGGRATSSHTYGFDRAEDLAGLGVAR